MLNSILLYTYTYMKNTNSNIYFWFKTILGGFIGALICVLFVSAVYFQGVSKDWFLAPDLVPEQKNEVKKENVITSDLPTLQTYPSYLDEDQPIVSVVKKASPAVVSIIISEKLTWYEKLLGNETVGGWSLQDFILRKIFGDQKIDFKTIEDTQKDFVDVGGGSGFFVTSDGLIVTNKHVVAEEDAKYTVFTSDGQEHEATVIARDPQYDVALIKIEGNNYPKLTLADSDLVQVGETAIAIGNALGEFQNSVSAGVISGLGRSVIAGDEGSDEVETLDQVIQTDAAINLGNSGGPLLNIYGEVVGINVAIIDGSQNIGFALPSNSVIDTIRSVEKTGKIIRPYLGVLYVQLTPELVKINDLSTKEGAIVLKDDYGQAAVLPDSPADKAGIKEFDIITKIDNEAVTEYRPLSSIIDSHAVGDTIVITFVRNGVEQKKTVVLESISK